MARKSAQSTTAIRPYKLAPAPGNGRRFAFDGAPYYGEHGYAIGYDAITSTGKRKQPGARVLSEDLELRDLPRRQLTTTVRDLRRNFSTVSWAIRQHVNYVSTFNFRSRTGDRKLDQEIQDFHEWWSKPENCDPGGRHSLEDLSRIWEASRTVDGDVLVNRLAGSYGRRLPDWHGTIQTVEGDRILSFGGIPFGELGIDPLWVINGVHVEPETFKALSYMVFRRPPQWVSLLWDRAVSAAFSDLFGYFERYDQVRGISPVASAANSFRDIYENVDYALLKAKVSQLMALAIFRKSSDEMGEIEGPLPSAYPGTTTQNGTTSTGGPANIDTGPGPRYKIEFGNKPVMLDLDPGDDAKILESQQPSKNFQDFNIFVTMVALKALDIPFSFFDESHTAYSGARLAGMQYELGAKHKRIQHRRLKDKNFEWRLRLAIQDGDIDIPARYLDAGNGRMRRFWHYEHQGIPWYDSLKEVSASIAGINAGIDSEIRVCQEHGLDFFEVIDQRAEAAAYAKEAGVVLGSQLPGKTLDDPNKATNAAEEESAEANENKVKQPKGPAQTDDDDNPAQKSTRSPDENRYYAGRRRFAGIA